MFAAVVTALAVAAISLAAIGIVFAAVAFAFACHVIAAIAMADQPKQPHHQNFAPEVLEFWSQCVYAASGVVVDARL